MVDFDVDIRTRELTNSRHAPRSRKRQPAKPPTTSATLTIISHCPCARHVTSTTAEILVCPELRQCMFRNGTRSNLRLVRRIYLCFSNNSTSIFVACVGQRCERKNRAQHTTNCGGGRKAIRLRIEQRAFKAVPPVPTRTTFSLSQCTSLSVSVAQNICGGP